MLLLALLAGCPASNAPDFDWPDLQAGQPLAGVAESSLKLPLGTPLGGYSSRCGYLGGDSYQDKRDSVFSVGFVESTGLHTRPKIKGFWLDNGDDHLLVLKADVIYSFDGLVKALTERLEDATGESLDGRVVLSTNHSHASYGPYSDSIHFYLGGDRFNREIFESFLSQLEAVALEAYETRQPAKIGNAWAKDWDPNDQVYRDRRGDNDSLAVWEDAEPGYGKDPFLHMLRIDTQDDEPLGMAFTFGVHGTALSGDSSMISSDAPGAIEWAIQESVGPGVMVMHLQGAGGDASPAGRDRDYARLESVGEAAIEPIVALWQETPTSDDPIHLESASRHHEQGLESIEVTRNGEVDWRYNPYKEGYLADEQIYDENGEILSPLDEFNAPYGAAFCGSDAPLIPAGNIGSEIFPYSACMDVELLSYILKGVFDMDEFPLPMPSSMKAGTTVSRVGPLETKTVDGSVVKRDLMTGFFPGETTAMFSEQWRRRVEAELGIEMPLMVGYAQDHEGYLMIPEDWLAGGYEPNINVWGPLQGEYLMEQTLKMASAVLMNEVREPADPIGSFSSTDYEPTPLLEEQPDQTPRAGERLEQAPEYFWLPLDIDVDLAVPESIPRVTGLVQMAWEGGDPSVDNPRVVLERFDGAEWQEQLSPSGRPVTEVGPEILLAHTPEPLYPSYAEQDHRYWAAWQAVGSVGERTALPLGRYRLRVEGQRYTGGSSTWPWNSEPYEVLGPEFELVEGVISASLSEGELLLSLDGPDQGWRMIHAEGLSQQSNPVEGPIELSWVLEDGSFEETVEGEIVDGKSRILVAVPEEASALSVEDIYGNTGWLEL
ncbi:MAG: neutral/alkaline non-lysosomal ceramidase N-terminal domain-containing protein [Myxococcota bacterium]|nr:neutral/alkaline non-lysosomal ceramidase N-terminal domain-containing protein [Myxococcota bacterium]